MKVETTGVRLDNWIVQFVDKVDAAIDETMADVAREGQEVLQNAIEVSGLGTVWSKARYKRGIRRTGSKNGRIWTGDMLADIEGVNYRQRPWMAVAEMGWVKTFKDYYGLQNEGFDHPDTGDHIAGMFIFDDTSDYIFHYAQEKLKGRLRAI